MALVWYNLNQSLNKTEILQKQIQNVTLSSILEAQWPMKITFGTEPKLEQ